MTNGSGKQPPLWTVPVLLIVVIVLAFYVSAALGWLGLIPLGVFVWWVQARADDYVRRRDS